MIYIHEAWRGVAWQGWAWQGWAWQGLARLGRAWQGLARQGRARHGGYGLPIKSPFILKLLKGGIVKNEKVQS
jgi:hypothetical protein